MGSAQHSHPPRQVSNGSACPLCGKTGGVQGGPTTGGSGGQDDPTSYGDA